MLEKCPKQNKLINFIELWRDILATSQVYHVGAQLLILHLFFPFLKRKSWCSALDIFPALISLKFHCGGLWGPPFQKAKRPFFLKNKPKENGLQRIILN